MCYNGTTGWTGPCQVCNLLPEMKPHSIEVEPHPIMGPNLP